LNIGPYQLLTPLGEGGVGQVFKAWDTSKGRVVALKVLRQDVFSRSDALRQFTRELEAVTRLSHPNIVKTFDADQLGTMHYFAMEYLEGVDLQRYVAETGPLGVEQACDYIRQVAQGLQHAHLLGLVHRDIKPANLLLINAPVPVKQALTNQMAPRRGPDPIVKILDWGLARIKPAEGDSPEAVRATTESEKGCLIGTADYVAPEQARNPSLVDTRADIYSLGCSFFFLLTGQPPFPGNSLMQKLLQHQEAEPPSVQQLRPDVPEEVDGIIRKMLAKQVEERFQIPLLVVAPLRRYCTGAMVSAGSVIRPSSSSNLGTVLRPGSSSNLNVPRPASNSNLGSLRPSSHSNFSGQRPGTGHRP
jgi:serine/threonine-protein kinase